MIISDGINHGKLQSVIIGELKKAGLKHRLKKIMLKSIKDHKTVFGAPLAKVPSCSVICCGSTLCVPLVVNEMSAVLRANVNVEGLFRKAGSQSRQKDIKRLLDAGGCVSNGHHPIDVASVLKLYLRSLPEPLISAEVQDLLLRCRLTAGDALEPLLHTLLLLPVLHVHLLHYIMELLNCIASKHKQNLMDTSNLAIVMAPSVMPLPAASSAQRLEHHVALVKIFIENSQQIGHLTEEMMTQLDEDSDTAVARRKKRRSGSLNRMFNGLRKMVSGTANTPAAPKINGTAPILSKSASKRKFDNYEGLSTKTKEQITSKLPMRELSFTPMKMGLTERKRLRLSMIDAKSTPTINSEYSSHKNSETTASSEDLLTSSEQLFSAHDTIDLSTDMKQHQKDYVRISKQEYEEIKSRVSAIENRLSREFTEIPRVEPLQQVQNVYEQTLEEVAMLNCPTSDHLARRLSKELKIRPNDQIKIIRSPSARKIGNIRRRSKENITKIVRHKSWASSQSQSNQNSNTFYPRVDIPHRGRTSTAKLDFLVPKQFCDKNFENTSQNSMNDSPSARHKYELRKRTSLQPESSPKQNIVKSQNRRSLNFTINKSYNETINSNDSREHFYQNINNISKKANSPMRQKWKNAAAFFMDKTGEVDKMSGRPSVNKLRAQNAGAVAAKARMFESSSDKSSELNNKSASNGFARKPRLNQHQGKPQKSVAYVKPKVQSTPNDTPSAPLRSNRNVTEITSPKTYQQLGKEDSWRSKKSTPSKVVSPTSLLKTPNTTTPMLKKPLSIHRNLRTPASIVDHRKVNTPLKAVHISPRRKSPRQKNRVN